jgi:hypothetical protein
MTFGIYWEIKQSFQMQPEAKISFLHSSIEWESHRTRKLPAHHSYVTVTIYGDADISWSQKFVNYSGTSI